MLIKNLIAMIFLTYSQFVFAGELQDQFEQANTFYQNGQFEEAVHSYESILTSGHESGDLYFNLGNAYYKMGLLGQSRVNYERSLTWMDGDEGLGQNLELLKLRLIDQIEPTPKLFIINWWTALINQVNPATFGNLVLVLFWIVLLSAALFLHYRKRGQLKFKGIFIALLIVFFLCGTVWVNKIYQFETSDYGVILSSTVTIYSSPAENSTELFVIHEGTKVQIERAVSEWYEIKLEDGKSGWLNQDVLEII